MGLLGCPHGGLQQILNGDLVPQSLIEQPLPGRQLAVGQDLNLRMREIEEFSATLFLICSDEQSPKT